MGDGCPPPSSRSKCQSRRDNTRREGGKQRRAAHDGRTEEAGRGGSLGWGQLREEVDIQRRPLLGLDEATLLEIFVRLGVAELANTASCCTAFSRMCRSEWLWRQLAGLRGIRAKVGGGEGRSRSRGRSRGDEAGSGAEDRRVGADSLLGSRRCRRVGGGGSTSACARCRLSAGGSSR
eukprot:759946-Hanusia_phi.AAC.1